MAILDVLTEDRAFEALKGLRGPADHARVMGLVTAVSLRLDEACGPIVRRTIGPTVVSGGGRHLFLDAKVSGTVTVTEAWSSEAPVAVLPADFVADDDGVGATLTRWSGVWAPRVTVTYTAGRFATTDAVTEPFVTAAGMLLQHWWRPANGGGSESYGLAPGFLATGIPSFGFPNTVRDVLAGEMLAPPVA